MPKLVDLSAPISEDQPSRTSDQRPAFWTISTHEQNAYRKIRKLGHRSSSADRQLKAMDRGSTERHPVNRGIVLSEHGPTHVDALAHFDPTRHDDGTIEQLPLEWFYREAVCVDVSHVGPDAFITVDDVRTGLDEHSLELSDGDAILLYTGHRDRHSPTDDLEAQYRFLHEFTGLNEEAAYWLGDAGVKIIGIDTPSPDHSSFHDTTELVTHDMSAEYECLHIERMANLDTVVGLRFTLCAFPLKLEGGTGSPVRPVAILDR